MENEKKSIETRITEIPYWYHKIELPGGIVTPGWSPLCDEKYAIPDDLTGKRVLDIGAWDGYWTFEALRRGAKEVVAIDDFSDKLGKLTEEQRPRWETFDLCREALGYSDEVCKRIEMSVYDISEETIGRFDVVFFFGTIYHLKHPLLALEKISDVCDGELYIESAVCDDFSSYKGGISKGYSDNDVVMEFYSRNQYGGNDSNWWCPTLQCLGEMVDVVGFKNINAWPLTEDPKALSECRGFVYGSKIETENKNIKKVAGSDAVGCSPLKIAAVMSVPRLGFQDNMCCILNELIPLKIPVYTTQGAFWGQCLERGIQTKIDEGADVILTIDYDTIFSAEDIRSLVGLMYEHPEADAIVPIQKGRSGMLPLFTMKSKTGQARGEVKRDEFEKDLMPISTGHFGLTLIRASSLLKLPHPWFHSEPNSDNQWGPGKIDDDIYFWKQMEKFEMNVYSANRIVIGHLELMANWPDNNLNSIYQTPKDYRTKGKPENAWK